jgi:hypothetical protein
MIIMISIYPKYALYLFSVCSLVILVMLFSYPYYALQLSQVCFPDLSPVCSPIILRVLLPAAHVLIAG